MKKRMTRAELHSSKNTDTESIDFTLDSSLEAASKLFEDINSNEVQKDESKVEQVSTGEYRAQYKAKQEEQEIRSRIQKQRQNDMFGQTDAQIFSEALGHEQEEDLDKTKVINFTDEFNIETQNEEDVVQTQDTITLNRSQGETQELIEDVKNNQELDDLMEQTIKLKGLVQEIKDKNDHTKNLLEETRTNVEKVSTIESEQTMLFSKTLSSLAQDIEEVERKSKVYTSVMFVLAILLIISIGFLVYIIV